jgi:hypothetical protein
MQWSEEGPPNYYFMNCCRIVRKIIFVALTAIELGFDKIISAGSLRNTLK